MPLRCKPIGEDEGLDWAGFLEAITPPPVKVCEQQPFAFVKDIPRDDALVEGEKARAPPLPVLAFQPLAL